MLYECIMKISVGPNFNVFILGVISLEILDKRTNIYHKLKAWRKSLIKSEAMLSVLKQCVLTGCGT